MSLPAGARVETILASNHPQAAVRSLPAQDLYLTVLEAGLDEASPLLPLASLPQLEFFLDIDGWDKDTLDIDRVCRWLIAFSEADPALVGRVISEADESLVVHLVSRLVFIYKNDESADPRYWPPDRAVTTIDSTYQIEAKEHTPVEAFDALHEALKVLRARSTHAFEALLEQVMWSIPAEMEQQAYESRASRLAEKGFPELGESLEVWAAGAEPLRELRARLKQKAVQMALPPVENHALPVTAAAAASAPLLARLGATLPLPQQEALLHGLVRVGNRFAVSSLSHLGDPETHRLALDTALAHANLGLAELTESENEDAARRALAGLSAAEIVRVGTGAVQSRAYRARRCRDGWLARVPLARVRLDEELNAPLFGLLSARPFYSLDTQPRPFRERADLQRVDAWLDGLDQLGEFLEQRWNLGPGRDLPELDRLPADRLDLEYLDWSTCLITALARDAVGDPARPLPFALAEVARALNALDAARVSSTCRSWGIEALAPLLLARLAEEWTPRQRELPIDPRFVRLVLLADENAR